MRLGLFMMPLHPPRKDYHQMLEEDLEAVIHADQLGFDDVWIGEHFSSMTEPITSPLTFLAKAIPLTKQIRLCTGVLNLPQQHPAVVAGFAAMFDHLADGRFLMGIGPGGLPSDFELFHLEDPMARGRMTLEFDRHHPQDLGRRAALRHPGRVLADPPEGVALARARPRRHAQALPAAAPADRGRRHEPLSVLRQGGGAARLAGDQRELHPGGERRDPLAALQRGLRRRPASSPTASAGTSAARSW